MTPPRALALLALSAGCIEEPTEPLSRVSSALSGETAEASAASVSLSLVLAGLTAELCASQDEDVWASVKPGDPPPFDAETLAALGDPVAEDVDLARSGAARITLGGLDALDYEDATALLYLDAGGAEFSLQATLLTASEGASQGSTFGQVQLNGRSGCTAEQGWVSGSLQWTIADGSRYAVAIPGGTSDGLGLAFGTGLPYLPSAGSLRWSGRMRGEDRLLDTRDAVRISESSAGDAITATWPADATGDGWEASGLIPLAFVAPPLR